MDQSARRNLTFIEIDSFCRTFNSLENDAPSFDTSAVNQPANKQTSNQATEQLGVREQKQPGNLPPIAR